MDQVAWQEYKLSLFKFTIERRRMLFTWTKNPIHALEAYRAARAGKIEVPSWILEVFDGWADALCVSPPKGAKEIAAALGLATKGGPSITAQAEIDARDWWIVERIVFALRDRGPRPDAPKPEMLDAEMRDPMLDAKKRDPKPEMLLLDVFNQVGEEFHLSSERVQQIWYKLTGHLKH